MQVARVPGADRDVLLLRRREFQILAVTLVLLLAAVLRIYHITQQSIWFDEAFAWNIVIQDDMFPRIAADTHPPLYYLLLRGWISLAGDSPLALRYLSALISLGTVAVLYRVAGELVRGRRALMTVPLLAALMLALSDAEIFLAQEARNYSLYTFFACLSVWLYLRWLGRPSRRRALWWAASTAALVYTHYQGLFIPAVQAMHVLFFLRGRRRVVAVGALALSAAATQPWFIAVTIPQARHAIDNSLPFAIPSNWETFLYLRDNYLGAMWPLLLVLALAGVGTLADVRRRPGRETFGRAFLVVMWFALPFGVLFFGNFFARLLTERKLLIIAPAIALMVAFGLGWLERAARGLVVAAILLYGLTSVDYYRVKEPWDQISAAIVPYVGPTDLALIEAGVGQYPVKYYWKHLLPQEVTISTFPFLGDYTMAPTTDVYTYYDGLLPQLLDYNQEHHTGSVATAWLVFWSKDRTVIERLEEAGYVHTMTTTYNHMGNAIDVYRYDDLPDTSRATYQSGMTLHAAEIDPEALRIDLWWGLAPSIESLERDYVTSAFLLDENGTLVAQLDSPPENGQRPTRGWRPGDVIYDPHLLALTAGQETLPPGEYTVGVQVYSFAADGSIELSPPVDAEDGDTYVSLGTLTYPVSEP